VSLEAEESLADLDSPESWLPSAGLSALALDFFGAPTSGADSSATARRDLRTGLASWISSIY
jgi:hypothetical protein